MKTLVLLLLSFSTTTAFAAYGLGLGQMPKYPAGFRAYGYVYSGRQGWVLKTRADTIKLDTLFKRFVYRPAAQNKDKANQTVDTVMQPCLQMLNMTLAEFDAQTKQTVSPDSPTTSGG